MIIIEPLGGLANRMRVIASGLWLQKQLDTKLKVIWNNNYELSCPYELLFEPSTLFAISEKSRWYRFIKSSNQVNKTDRLTTQAINKLMNIDYCIQEADFPALVWTKKLDIYEAAKSHQNIYIQTCQEFGDNKSAFTVFKPVSEIASKINAVTQDFGATTIGIHIRRTDNSASIEHSPLELFVAAIEAEIQLNSDIRFFLSTDDHEVESTLKQAFGNRIITYAKENSRQTIKGMQDALVDLFCLSKTDRILGSYYSSFSDIAARIGNIPLQIIKKTADTLT